MNELKSYTEYAVSTPTADFVIGFDFNYGEDAVNVTVDDVPATEAGYTVVYLNETTIRLSPSVPSGVVRLQRETDIDQSDHAYRAGAKFIAQTMDENFEQLRHSQQEVRDGFVKLADDTYEIIDTLNEVGQSAQDAADAAEVAAELANNAAAQVNDKVSYTDFNNKPHNAMLARDAASAHPTSSILDGSGETQQQVNYNGGSKWYSRVGGYLENERVVLTNGDIVKSTVGGNTNDPNVDMTGWVSDHSRTAVILTLEMFGGKTFSDDPLFDNADIIDNMFRSLYSLYDTHSGLTSAQIRNTINGAKPAVIQLNGLYRTTRQFHIPPSVTIKQCFEGYFTQNPKTGIFYDPTDLNTYAVAPFLYRKNVGGTYDLDTDVMSMPSGFDFDNGTCIMAGVRQQLINMFVLTKRGVTLAYRLVGWAGCYAENIGCGENQSTWARNPKVACIVASAWGARINGINTLSTHQGFVSYNANGGLVVDGMYTNQSINSDYAATNNLIEPLYKPSSYTQLGTTGVMQMGEGKFNSPICEGWYNVHVATNRVSIDEPHYERVSGYNFYLINCEADINLKGVTGVEALSIFYLKDYRDFNREVKVRGLYSMGGNLVLGENSDPSLVLDVLRPHSFIQFYKWGNLNLIKSIENKWGVTQVYVNPVTGDDSYVGLRDIRPLKTLDNAKTLCRLFNISDINILSELTVSSVADTPKKVRFLGSKIVLNAPLRVTETGDTSVDFLNSEVGGTTPSVLLFNGQYNRGYINVTANINCPSAVFIQATGSLDVDVNIKNTSTTLSSVNYCPTTQQNAIGWNVLTTTYTVPYIFGGGGGFFKGLSKSLSVGTIAVASEALAAGATKSYDVSVRIASLGMNAAASHSVFTNGLIYSANIKSAGVVSVTIQNTSTSSINIPSGTITAKVSP